MIPALSGLSVVRVLGLVFKTYLIQDFSGTQQWKVKHQLDDPNDVIPRHRQLQIVTCLKYKRDERVPLQIYWEVALYIMCLFCFCWYILLWLIYFDLWWFKICGTVWFCHLRGGISYHSMLVFASVGGESCQHFRHFVGSSDVNIRKHVPRCGLCRTSTHASLSRLYCLQCCSLAFRVYQNPSVELWNCPCLAIQRVCCSL